MRETAIQIIDVFLRCRSALTHTGIAGGLFCPFCDSLLRMTDTLTGCGWAYACENPACDAAPWMTKQTAIDRAHLAAIAEDHERDRAYVRRAQLQSFGYQREPHR